ncbi:TPA: hypothetical protein ACTZ52_005431 [Bacillus cereus]
MNATLTVTKALARLNSFERNSGNNNQKKLKTVTNGKLKVYNVPHQRYPNGIGPDGEEYYISANVVYKLSIIFRYMLDNKQTEFNFKEYVRIQ